MTSPINNNNTKRENHHLTAASPSRENAALALSALFHTSTEVPAPVAKKPRQDSQSRSSRRDKSLGTLCENFITKYEAALLQREAKLAEGETTTPDLLISIDAAAAVLGVERRRIYDIINILESLDIVSRKCKNTYIYAGRGEALTTMLGKLQDKAIALFPEDAILHGICSAEEAKAIQEKRFEAAMASDNIFAYNNANTCIPPISTSVRQHHLKDLPKEKSLGKLSNRFIQYFLVGNSHVSLAHAATRVLNLQLESNPIISSKDGQHKTKIRRLYDIANVMLSIGLLRKMDDSDGGFVAGLRPNHKRQFFTWAWTDLKQLRQNYVDTLHEKESEVMKSFLNEHEVSQTESSINAKDAANSSVSPSSQSFRFSSVDQTGEDLNVNASFSCSDVATNISASIMLPAVTPSSAKYSTASEVTPTPLAGRHNQNSAAYDAIPQQLAHV